MTQSETIAFLSTAAAFRDAGAEVDPSAQVEVVETHGALVFLCDGVALKLKRAVTYDYMDFGEVDLRHRMLVRELELNAPAAPTIYRDVLPVVRGTDGIALGGAGPVLDWVLRMWRFPAEDEFEAIAARGALDDALATATGEAVAAYHAAAPVVGRPGAALIADILAELGRVFAEFPDAPGTARVGEWRAGAARALEDVRDLLDARGREGHVRRVHGDLHLRNLVRIDGRPVLFDALEFDETLGTCDVLYDIAYLVMDLCHRDLPRQACRVLDAWTREMRGREDAGLAALPLFLSVRAAIRAMVVVQTDAASDRAGASTEAIATYLDLACAALVPAAPRLLAVGGCSGTGKSVLAGALAPEVGALPGAVQLVSDLERKAGRPKDAPLDAAAYTDAGRAAVYRAVLRRAETILCAGHAVLLDATFLDEGMRAEAEAVADRTEVPFDGLWLDAPVATLEARVRDRTGSASDADIDVLHRQLAARSVPSGWLRIDASGSPAQTCARARAALQAGRARA